MAGAGFKTFNTGDVLTASDVNTYLMQQTVMVFDDAAARTSALGANVAEGMFSYLKDTNLTYRYDGSSWLSDAGTTSPLTTKGDVWGYSTTDARIPVGANGTVLTADSAETLGVKWATPASGSTFSGVLVRKSANQSINNTTSTILSFDTEIYDVDGWHDNVTNNSRLTVPSGKGGYIWVWGLVVWANNGTGRRIANIKKNGTNSIQWEITPSSTSGLDPGIWIGKAFDAVATDYFELEVFQSSGGSLNVSGGQIYNTQFGAYWLGA